MRRRGMSPVARSSDWSPEITGHDARNLPVHPLEIRGFRPANPLQTGICNHANWRSTVYYRQ
jgi:hypothetical protein